MTNRSQNSGQRTAICHFSLVIFFLRALSVSTVRSLLVAAGPTCVHLWFHFIRFTVVLDLEDFAPSQCRLVGDDAGQRVSDGLIHVDGRVTVLYDRANELVGEESV